MKTFDLEVTKRDEAFYHFYQTQVQYQNKPTKPSQAQQPNLPIQTYQTKSAKPNLSNQNYWSKQSTPGSVVPLAMFLNFFLCGITACQS